MFNNNNEKTPDKIKKPLTSTSSNESLGQHRQKAKQETQLRIAEAERDAPHRQANAKIMEMLMERLDLKSHEGESDQINTELESTYSPYIPKDQMRPYSPKGAVFLSTKKAACGPIC